MLRTILLILLDPKMRNTHVRHMEAMHRLRVEQEHELRLARIRSRPHEADPVDALWTAEGGHNANYVTEAGVVLLPPSVRDALRRPCLVRFAPTAEPGVFTMTEVVDEDAN